MIKPTYQSCKPLDSQHSIDSCTLQLHSWRPFQSQTTTTKIPDFDSHINANPRPYYSSSNSIHTKRPCLSDCTTSSFSVDAIDLSKLSLIEDDKPTATGHYRSGSYHLIARKRWHRGSRSVSGRGSDRSGTHRCCSVGASATYGTCSDFSVAMGIDSSGELFGNGDADWSSDVSEAKNSRKYRDKEGGSGEKENLGLRFGVNGSCPSSMVYVELGKPRKNCHIIRELPQSATSSKCYSKNTPCGKS